MLFPETVKHVCWWHVRAAASSYSRTVVQSYSRTVGCPRRHRRPGTASKAGAFAWCLVPVQHVCSFLSLFIAVIIKVALHGIDR